MSAAPAPAALADTSAARTATVLTLIVTSLVALGVVLVYSSSSVGSELRVQDATLFLRRQLLWVALAAGVFVLARTTEMATLRRFAPAALLGTGLLLLVVLIPGVGHRAGGARRWIDLGVLRCQPTELAKITLVLFTAAWASGRRDELRELRGALPGLGVVCLTAGLIALEPDMGTALLCGTVSTALLVVAGVRLRHLLLVGAPAGLLLFAFAWNKLPYVWSRIHNFLDPNADPDGVGYQTRQALIALGSGGTWGVGLGASEQKRLFLPDVHTDFIFALVGEELGFAGGLAVLGLFCAFVLYGLRAADRARDAFSFLVATGIVLTLGLQSLLNVAVATASVPPKGIPLPFLSYGGSSLLGVAAAAGILVRVAAEGGPARRDEEPAPVPAAA